jgi:hydroxyacylglutathione hydrolase
MVIQRVEQGEWLSNAYLIVDEIGGTGVLVDSNGVTDPLCERAEREGTDITHVLLTHHHWDHVFGVEQLAERFSVPVLAHELTAELLEGTVGGTRAPGATGFEDLKTSIMGKLMTLPPETRIHPGHREPSTVAAEWEHNPFVRIWRGLDPEGSSPCSIGPADADEREPATLILWAPDYDGGNKAWVRFEDGADAIVGGSQVKRD